MPCRVLLTIPEPWRMPGQRRPLSASGAGSEHIRLCLGHFQGLRPRPLVHTQGAAGMELPGLHLCALGIRQSRRRYLPARFAHESAARPRVQPDPLRRVQQLGRVLQTSHKNGVPFSTPPEPVQNFEPLSGASQRGATGVFILIIRLSPPPGSLFSL